VYLSWQRSPCHLQLQVGTRVRDPYQLPGCKHVHLGLTQELEPTFMSFAFVYPVIVLVFSMMLQKDLVADRGLCFC
jgi:hypothetical protein